MLKTRIAVFVSGGGTNLQALLDAQAAGKIPSGEIVLVAASNPKAYALDRAARAGVKSVIVERRACGSQEDFAKLMNATAREIGMEHSSFANPNGLDHEDHYSTARDMARLACAAVENETLVRMASTRSVTIGGRTMTNHNKLLNQIEGCIGLKTGYTMAAGRTLVSCVERNGQRLVAVTLQDGNDWADHAALYDWGFAQPAGQETADHRREDTP